VSSNVSGHAHACRIDAPARAHRRMKDSLHTHRTPAKPTNRLRQVTR
jgi:hypothetical protein